MGKKLLIVGAVLALSGGVGLFSRTEQKRTSWMDRMGKTGNTIGASFALLFGIAFLIAGAVLTWRGV